MRRQAYWERAPRLRDVEIPDQSSAGYIRIVEMIEAFRARVKSINFEILNNLIAGLRSIHHHDDSLVFAIILELEWSSAMLVAYPDQLQSLHDLYQHMSDGTSPVHDVADTMLKLNEIETELGTRCGEQVQFPEEFRTMCAIVDRLSGPGLPNMRTQHTVEAFWSTCEMRATLEYIDPESLEPGNPHTQSSLQDVVQFTGTHPSRNWEVISGVQIGAQPTSGDGGVHLCYCRSTRPGREHRRKWIYVFWNQDHRFISDDLEDFLGQYLGVYDTHDFRHYHEGRGPLAVPSTTSQFADAMYQPVYFGDMYGGLPPP